MNSHCCYRSFSSDFSSERTQSRVTTYLENFVNKQFDNISNYVSLRLEKKIIARTVCPQDFYWRQKLIPREKTSRNYRMTSVS